MALIDWRDDPRAARTDPRLHSDQAWWHAREPRLKSRAPTWSTSTKRVRSGPNLASAGDKQSQGNEVFFQMHLAV